PDSPEQIRKELVDTLQTVGVHEEQISPVNENERRLPTGDSETQWQLTISGISQEQLGNVQGLLIQQPSVASINSL
ncbi:MAG: hypothetical protein V1876_04155, partial [Candidatus Peregrinibacteria bacterium]